MGSRVFNGGWTRLPRCPILGERGSPFTQIKAHGAGSETMGKLNSTIRLQGKEYHAEEAQRGQKDMAAEFIAAAKQHKVDIERLVRDGHIELTDAEFRELIEAQRALVTGAAPAVAPAQTSATEPAGAEDQDSATGINATDSAIALAASVEPPVDLATVTGTGLEGRITKKDVQDVIDARSGE